MDDENELKDRLISFKKETVVDDERELRDKLVSYGTTMGQFVMANEDLCRNVSKAREKVLTCLHEIEKLKSLNTHQYKGTHDALNAMKDCMDGAISNFEHIVSVNGIKPYSSDFRNRMVARSYKASHKADNE